MAVASLFLVVIRAQRAFGGALSALLKLWRHGFFGLLWLDGFPVLTGPLWPWWTSTLIPCSSFSWPQDLGSSPLLGRWGFGGSISAPHVTWQYGSNRDPVQIEVPLYHHNKDLVIWSPCYPNNGSSNYCEVSLNGMCVAKGSLPSFSLSVENVLPHGVRVMGEFVAPSSSNTSTLMSFSSLSWVGISSKGNLCYFLLLHLVPSFPSYCPIIHHELLHYEDPWRHLLSDCGLQGSQG
eukprot:Gb_16468 [translate_table: standard]